VIALQICIVLAAIIAGTKLKGISLGIFGGLGLALLVFFFHIKPTDPPFEVLLIITSVVTAASALEAAGGLGYLTYLAEKTIRKYPNRITFIAPLIMYMFTFLAGTGHIIYSILPIIANVARQTGVRPERPLTVTVIAAQQAAMASPISAPTAILLSILSPYGIELMDLLGVLIPATLGGVLLATFVANKMGKPLNEDPAYIKLLQSSPGNNPDLGQPMVNKNFSRATKSSVGLFIVGIFIIIVLGAFKNLRPSWLVHEKLVQLDMPTIIEIIMLSTAAFIVLFCKAKATEITKTNVFGAGIQAVVSILGIAWLGDTFVKANQGAIMEAVQAQILKYPWQFSIILFIMSMFLVSQTATIRALMPLGLALGIAPLTLLASAPAVNGLFFIPNYPMLLAAINLDTTGTTRIGRFMLNHSFMLPGLIATSGAVLIAFGLIKCFF
jgi:anaerobic C4-dicarboxylate transporter DcuA